MTGFSLTHATSCVQVEKRQREFERLRAAALDCMKQMLDLLMRRDGVLAAVTPLQKLLVDDMKGSSAGSLCPGQAASPVTPAHSAPSTPRGKTPVTHQVTTNDFIFANVSYYCARRHSQ